MSAPSPSRDDCARDEATRRRAQCAFDRPLVVEAGAGTGKTAVLISRILAWCLGPGWERTEQRIKEQTMDAPPPAQVARELLPRVVAITFTDAAAAEMARRVSSGLLDVVRGEMPVGLAADALPDDLELRTRRAHALHDASDQIVIQTIHAFCLRLLRSHPLAVGLHPSFTVDASGAETEAVARAQVEAFIESAYRDTAAGNADAIALAQADIGPPKLEQALLALLQAGAAPELLREPPTAKERIATWRAEFLPLLDTFEALEAGRIRALTKKPACRRLAGNLVALRAKLAALPDQRDALVALAKAQQELWPPADRKRLHDWARGKAPFDAGDEAGLGRNREPLRACVECLVPFVNQFLDTDFDVLERAQRVLGLLLTRAHAELRRRGVQSFSALLRDAEQLLARNPDITRRFRGGTDQLLVDEFQDTDALQCRILRHLTKGKGGPTLFLVGDPKQSIYGWRNADLQAYSDFVTEVEPDEEERGLLCVNHRSSKPLLDEVQRCLEPVFGTGSEWQAAFQRLLVSDENARAHEQPNALADAAAVEHWISRDWKQGGVAGKTRSARANEIEAEAVARDIADQVAAGGSKPGHFAILLRALGDLDVVLSALRSRDINYVVERDQSYYQRREIIDVSALLCWLLDPNDHLAWAAVLRSSLVGAPDAALLPLWRGQLPQRAGLLYGADTAELAALQHFVRTVALPRDVPGLERIGGWRENLAGLLALAGPLRERAARLAPDRFVEALRRVLLFEASEAGRPLGRFRLANLDRFFRDLVVTLEEQDRASLLGALRQAVSTAKEQEEGRPRAMDDDAVHVMSIHKAKGLDFEQVYVLQLHRGSRANAEPANALLRRGERQALRLFGFASLEAPALLRAQRETERAERERLLYVAMTRARRRLVLAGKTADEGRGSASGTLIQLLEKRRERLDIEGLAGQVAKASAAPHHVDRDHARWVFPAAARTRAEGAVATQRKPRRVALSLERARSDAEQIRARRLHARQRMARFGHSVASAEHGRRADIEAETRLARSEALEVSPAHPAAGAFDEGDDDKSHALRAGSAVHAALEAYKPVDTEDGRARAVQALEAVLAGERDKQPRRRAAALWRKFLEGPLHTRFCELAPSFVARELAVLAPPEGSGALHFASGVIDLVYRDPASGNLVVVDYKTDKVGGGGGGGLSAHAERYRGQGEVYCRALQQALSLASPPAFELWFLDAGEIVQV